MSVASGARDTENAMLPRQITHQNIFRVLTIGFALVILLLLAAAMVGIRNIQLIQENAASLVRDQGLTNRLIDELHSQQTSLSEVFSVLARDPDSVDFDGIAAQLDTPSSKFAKAIVGSANVTTATICKMTNNQPSNVCTAAGVTKAAALLGS